MARSPRRQRTLTIALLGAVLALAAACGSSSSSSSSGGGGGGGSTSSGGGGVATLSDSSFCSLAKKWSKQESKQITTLTNLTRPTGMKAFYTTLAKDYQSVIAVAPSDIKPSLDVLYGDFTQLTSILAKHNYNIEKAAPDLASVQGIFNSAKTKAAIAKLDAWGKANNCHV